MLCFRRLYAGKTPKFCLNQPVAVISSIFLRYTSTESFALAYQIYEGDVQDKSSPVLVIHGMLGSKKNWHTFCKSYSQQSGKKVIAVDCRNHGQSPHSDHMTYPLLAGDIAETLKQLDISKSILIGHSMGGKAAMELALSMPSVVEKLILVDITPVPASTVKGTISMVPMVLSAMVGLDLSLVKSRKDADELLAKSIPVDGLRAWVLTGLLKDKKGNFYWQVNLKSIQEHGKTVYGGIEINNRTPFTRETLFIGGEESDVLRNVDMNEIRRIFPRAQLEMIPGAGHFVHADKPKEFREIVHSFLR